MNKIYGTKKYEADKIAFLGLFVLALLTARLVTSSRHTLPLKTGGKIVAEIKSKGINSFISGHSQQDFFLFKDTKGNILGFTMNVLIDSGTNEQLNIQAADYSYIRGRHIQEQVTLFQSDNNLGEFLWKSETAGPSGRIDTQILMGKDGTITVTSLGRNQREQSYKPGPATMPSILLDLVLRQMLHGNRKKIIVNIINSDGTMFDSTISRIKTKNSDRLQTGAEYVLNVEFQNGRHFSEKVYLDGQKQVLKVLLQQERLYILERTDMENILREFPERADYILQKNKMLEENQSQKNDQRVDKNNKFKNGVYYG